MWRVGIYCRLSKDDELQGESASISNQRDMLTAYCESQGWTIVTVFQDDGFTGLNMDRPGLQKTLRAVEKGTINLVITKDLSRLGRNYLETGNLMEDFFPRHGVRYIAVNDGIDTLHDSNEIAPFKNILNEMYSKDVSKKVHSSYLLHAKQGKYTGNVPPLGYRKDPDQPGHLLIDDETAWIVRKIFDYALEGKGSNYIRRRLEIDKVPTPLWWLRQRGQRNQFTKWELQDPENGRFIWDFGNIEDMLSNPVYIGTICSQKRNYRFKIGVIGDKRPDEWISVENQHEPIIDRRTFDIVQGLIRRRQHPRTGEDNYSLFSGLIKCGNCGKALTIRYTNAKHPIQIYSCVTYNKYGKQHCTQHRVEYDMLYDMVLERIRDLAQEALADSEAIAERLNKAAADEANSEKEMLRQQLIRDQDRMKVLDKMVSKLYEDMISGRISEANFDSLLTKTQKEQSDLQKRIQDAERICGSDPSPDDQTKAWVEEVRQYADITELDREMLNRLIREIVVYENIDDNKTRHISIEIHFNIKAMNHYGNASIEVTA